MHHFGSIVLGLYDKQGRLIHVGQAGSGFNQKSLAEIWKLLKKRETKQNPFYGEVEALRKVFWVKPELVAEIEYAEWTEGAAAAVVPNSERRYSWVCATTKIQKNVTLEDGN